MIHILLAEDEIALAKIIKDSLESRQEFRITPPGNFSFHPYFLTPSILLLLSSLIYNFISIKQFTIFPVFISIIAFVF